MGDVEMLQGIIERVQDGRWAIQHMDVVMPTKTKPPIDGWAVRSASPFRVITIIVEELKKDD